MLVALLAVLAAVAAARDPSPVPLADLGDQSAIRQLAERGEPTARLALSQGSLTPEQARSLQQELYVLQSKLFLSAFFPLCFVENGEPETWSWYQE